jgi:hypothetical protein
MLSHTGARLGALSAQWRPARQRRKPDGTLVLLPSRWQVAMSVVPFLPLVLFVTLAFHDPSPWETESFGRIAVVMVGPTALAVSRRRVELGPTSLRHRNILAWRTIEALDIQAITLTDAGLTESLRIWTSDRRSHRCVALTPVDLPILGDWWLEHRGEGWRSAWGPPRPAPPPFSTPGQR